MKQWKRLAALSSAIVMAAATLTYFPNDTLQNIRLEISASAETTTEPQVWIEDNLTWTLDADGTLTISGTGAMKDYNAADNLSPAYMNSNVKKVVIEDGVTSIGELAFFKCISLTNITIPDSVTCIEYAAFHGCSSLSSITIPNSVTSIGIYAFVVCSSLTSITIPDGVTSIGYGAFSDCSSLKTISLSCKSSLKKSDFGEQADLVSYTNQHLLTKTAAKAATCTESGNKEYWTCKYCGKYFLSDDTNPATATAVELSETVIPALNHKNAIIRNASEPNGTNPGYSGDRYCPDCDTVFEKGYTYWNEDNLTWKLYEDGTLTISGTGAMKDYDYYNNPSPASQKKDSVKKVVIEDGVTSIRNSAFYDCNSLTSITIPNSVTSIGAYAFSNCYYLTNITIPNSVTSIENYAFRSCSSLTSITIPDSVTSIGKLAFYSCDSLTSITISNSVTSIEERAFAYCSRLTSITIPDSVTSIGEAAFAGCSSLTSITIPDSVTSIGEYAFQSCSSLTTISLSCKSSLKRSDFGKQADLVSYTSHTLNKTEAKAATCTENGNKEYWTCEHCGKYFLSDDTNPETATAVEQSETILPALKHKNAITRGAVEPNGTKPGYSGDRYCPDCNTVLEKGYTYWIEDNLTWKLYEDGTLNISGTGAMKNYSYSNNKSPACSNLSVTSIVIEEGVTSIGDYAFENCDNLTSITIPENVEIIGKGAFYSCDNLKDVTLQDGVKIIERTAFIWCGNLTNIVLPNSITSIGDWAFKDCTSLTSIKIPSSVTSIDDPFYNCSSLKTISLDCGSSLKRTDFGKQADLVSYTPHTLIKTEAKPVTDDESGNKEYWTCSHCGKYFLSDDTNPETATAVELSEIIICNHKNAELRNASEPTETSPGYSGDLYCPDCDKVLEKGYTYWIEDNLTWKLYEDGTLNISGKGAMKDYIYGNNKSPARLNLSVTSIVIEEGVTSIGDYAFENCDNLTSITIPGNVESIGEDAFYNCDNLTDVTLQDGVKSIGRSAFIWCNNLTNIVLPNSVTSIGYFAFKDCTSLTSIKIPSSVTSMDSKAFYNCSSLETISLDCDSPLKRTDFGKQADLVSYTPHTLIKTEAKAATCTEDGNKAYWTCEHCGKYFLSDDTNPETAKAVELSETVIPASHKLTKVEAKDATCTEDGNTEYWTCEHCGKYFLSDDTNPETAKAVELSETVIPASHKLTKVEAKAATCTEDGNIEYWQCDVCKKTFTDEAGKKTVDNVIIPALKHSYNENGFCENDDTHYQPANYNEEIEKYEISNAGQLYWFAEQVNSGDTSLNAVLTTDIVVNETVLAADGFLGADPDTLRMWRSIGDDDTENIFKGIFDGQGHTISGLYFSNDSNESDVMCASLFGFSAGIIQNVGLEDSYFNYYYAKIDGQLIVSGVAAGICAANNGQIVNCYNAGTILGYGASGICVINSGNGSIENCYNTGVIRGFGLVAGICNLNAGSMKDCYNNNSDITVMTDSTIIDENDEKSYASGICNINDSSGRIENCYHVGQVSGADVNNNICNHNEGQIENSYYDCNICDKDAITQNESSAVVKNVEGKTTKQFASGEVTYLLNGDQSVRAFYQNLAKEKYPTLNQKSKVVMQLERIYDESFGEDATTNKTYHNAGDTIALETSPDKAYTYQYFVNGKQIEKPNYTLTGNTKMTVKRVPVEIELSEIDTIQLTCQKKMTLDLTAYLKNFADLKPVQFQLDADSKLPDGLKLTEDGILSGTPKKAATVKTTIVLTAENDSTKEMNLVFIINAPVTTTTTTITTTTTTKATTTTKPSKTTTTKVTTTTKPNKTTTTKATTTTKPSKTTTTKVTTTTKPSKTTTTNATMTTKPSKTTTTKATTTTKPNKTTTTNATTTTKPSKTTTTEATTTTKPSKTTTTNATTTTKPNKTTTTNATTTTKPNKTTTTKATTTTITTTTNTAIPSYGDVNLDGKVDILDAVFLNKYLATLIQFSDAQVANADCYQDGVLDDQDTTALMQFIILLIDDLPVQPNQE